MSTPEKTNPDQKAAPQPDQSEPVKDPKQQGDNADKSPGGRIPG